MEMYIEYDDGKNSMAFCGKNFLNQLELRLIIRKKVFI